MGAAGDTGTWIRAWMRIGKTGNAPRARALPTVHQDPNPAAIPAPDSPSLSEPLPSPRGISEEHPDWESPFDKKCEPSRAPIVDRTRHTEMPWDHLHDQCPRRGFSRKESRKVLKTRLTTMDAAEDKRNLEESASQDTPVCNPGIRERAPGEGVMD